MRVGLNQKYEIEKKIGTVVSTNKLEITTMLIWRESNLIVYCRRKQKSESFKDIEGYLYIYIKREREKNFNTTECHIKQKDILESYNEITLKCPAPPHTHTGTFREIFQMSTFSILLLINNILIEFNVFKILLTDLTINWRGIILGFKGTVIKMLQF